MFPKLKTKPHNLGRNSTSRLVYWNLLSITPPEITFKSPCWGCFTIDAGCWTQCVWLTDIIQTLGSVISGSQPSAGADIHIMELRQARSPMQERVKTMENVFCIDGKWNTIYFQLYELWQSVSPSLPRATFLIESYCCITNVRLTLSATVLKYVEVVWYSVVANKNLTTEISQSNFVVHDHIL